MDKNINNNTTKREWVKREMLCTELHVRDTPRVPIGDVLIKCWSLIEHCDNERGWERVCIHSNNSFLLRKICLDWKRKKKKNEKIKKTKMDIRINNKQQKENGWKERCYVLWDMCVTLPVFQLEMSWLNAEALANTVTMNGVGKEFVSIQTINFCWGRFV